MAEIGETRRIRFLYGGTWTRWYDDTDAALLEMDNVEVEAVEIQETMTRAEFERRYGDK